MEDKKRSVVMTFKILILLILAILTGPRPTFALGQPSLNTPGWYGYAEGTSVSFSWDPFPNANGYLLAIYTNSSLSTVFSSAWVENSTSTTVYNFPNTCKTYYWRVLAYQDGNIISDWSNSSPFINGPGLPPNAPWVSVSGSAGYVAFQWQPSARAMSYTVGSSTNGPYNFGDTDVGTSTSFGSGTPDIGEVYYWRVGAHNCYNGGSASYSYGSFLDGPSAPPGAPTLLYPDNGTTVADFDMFFNWGSAARASAYRLEVASDSVFSSNKIIYTDMFDSLDDTIYDQINGLLMKGQKYYWRVGAWNSSTAGPIRFLYKGINGSLTYSPIQWFIYDDALSCTSSQGYGIGLTANSQPDIDTCKLGAYYYLYDISRQAGQAGHNHGGSMTPPAAIKTKDYYYGLYFWETNNVWNDYPSGVDAHVYAGKVYDYLKSQFSLNSFDNGGSSMVSAIEMPCAEPGAFWDGTKVRFCATDAYGVKPFSGALDAVAHEWGHAVTQMASTVRGAGIELDYEYESGALNEAFSDWLGTAVEHFYGKNNWTMGENIYMIRDLENPLNPALENLAWAGQTVDFRQPDTYKDTANRYLDYNTSNCTPPDHDNCGVHRNSGVPNKMFYLLSQGGTHNGVTVQGLGIQKAMAIGYLANKKYWQADTTFMEALDGMDKAAKELYPQDPNVAYQVQNAWAAVGMGTLPMVGANTSPVEGGTVCGEGSYEWGTSVTVTATAAAGYTFVNWTENGLEVSTSASYTFTLNGSRSLTANFAAMPPTASVTPPAGNFITTWVGEQSPPITFTIKNSGLNPLIISAVYLGGNNSSDFTKSTDYCYGQGLTTNATCTVQVKFAPTSGGTKVAYLYIQSNDPVNGLIGIPLSGTGEIPPTITASAGIGGSISPSGAMYVSYGGSKTFSITPNTGYYIDDVRIDNMSHGAVSSYTFTNVIGNHTIEASFLLSYYTITTTVSGGSGGTISPSSPTVNYGGSQTFTFTPNAGYHTVDVKVDSISKGAVSSYTISNATSAHTVEASFSNTYTITATAGANGSISPAGAVTVTQGGGKTFTITPNASYHVADVKVDGISQGAWSSYSFSNVAGNHTIEASFAINTYNITATAGANGSISPSGTTTVNYGSNQSFTITPNANYHVADVLVDGVSVGAVTSYTFSNVTVGHTIFATFAINTYTVTASAGSNGSISPYGNIPINYGANQAVTITPNANYHVADVLVDGVSVGAVTSYTFSNVTIGHTISASFAINTFTITPSAGTNGTISPATVQTVNYNGITSFTAMPSTGYHIDSVTGCGGTLSGNMYTTGTVTSDCAVTAIFAINTYTVNPSAGANGSISPAISQTLNYNGTTSFTVTPNTGYHIESLTGCGGTHTGNSYMTGAITSDCTVTATFAINTYTLSVAASGTGTGIVTSSEAGISCGTDCEEIYPYGSVVTLAVVPESNATFAGWGGDGGCVGTESCTVTISDNLSITAAFTTPHPGFSAVSAAGIHTAAIGNDGTLWTWGGNWYGELGDETTTDRHFPLRIGTGTNWSTVSAGNFHTSAIKTDGTLWTWGNNADAQLGDGTTIDKWIPVKIGIDTDWLAVSAGYSHTLAIKANGTLWAWGNNWSGQLGDGTGAFKSTPVQIGTDTNWATVYARDYHTFALKTDGTLWAWGDNSYGQLGDGTWDSRLSPVQIGADTNWAKIAAGVWHTMALKSDGTLWGWGLIDSWPLSPVQMGSDAWNAVDAGYSYTAMIKTDGTLWQWGCSGFGILGDCTTSDMVKIGMDVNWVNVTIGEDHAVATMTDGTLWAWGSNWYGQVGDGTTIDRLSPVQLFAPPTSSVTPESNNFGSYFVEQPSPPVPFTIGNSSLEPLVIRGVSISGIDSSSFAILSDGCTGRTLIKNSSCTVQVRFQSVSANAKTAALNIQSNDPAHGLLEIPISGSGVPLTIMAAAGSSGNISPSGPVAASYNGSTTFDITPGTGYHIASVVGCGGMLSGNIYTTAAITAYCTVTASFAKNIYTLTVTKSGSDLGALSSQPAGINCGSDCGGEYEFGTVVTLTAAPDICSTFEGWSGGGCSGIGTCTLTMTDNTDITANFSAIPPVRIIRGGTPVYYSSTINPAYASAVSGDTIQSHAVTFNENVTANRDISVRLDGGYSCDYSSNNDSTVLKGSLTTTTTSGTVNIKNFNLQF